MLLAPVKGFEGHYSVSMCGKVFSRKYGKLKRLKTSHRDGYRTVGLCLNGQLSFHSVHRVVLEAWQPHPDSATLQVNHRDGNKANNHYSNLEWVNQRQNVLHAYKTGLRPKKYNRLTIPQVRQIKRKLEAGATQLELAELFSVGKSTINFIAKGRIWKEVNP